MKLLLYKILIFLVLFSTKFSFSMKKAVIFEIDDVLFNIDETANFYKMFKVVISNSAQQYRNRLFELLSSVDCSDKLKKKYNNLSIFFKEKEIPKILYLYYLNKITSNEIIEQSRSVILDKTNWFSIERKLLLKAISIAFDPNKEANLFVPNEGIFAIVRECQKEKFHLIVLANKNINSFISLKKKYPKHFKFFNKNFLISGKINLLKPDREVYEHLWKKYKLAPKDCYIIESQKKYVEKANKLGMNGILFNQSNYKEIKERIFEEKA